MSYTKGEWTLTNEMLEIKVHTKEMDICSVWEIDIEPEEAEANAKLISAAPELLKWVQHIATELRIGRYLSHFELIELEKTIQKATS